MLFTTSAAFGYTLRGTVTKVLDGQCVVIKDEKKKLHTIRMSGIDIPLEGQKFHNSATLNLVKLAMKKKVTIEWDKYDDYCEKAKIPKKKCWKVGQVLLDGVDLNLEQVKAGFAWHSPFRMNEQSTPDRTLYGEAELKAREKKAGLWKEKKPVPPWEFKRHGLSTRPKDRD